MAIRKVPIQRVNPFTHSYGDVHENIFAFMLDELDDDVGPLIDHILEVNRNLDVEIYKLNGMIGETGNRDSTRFAEIAS